MANKEQHWNRLIDIIEWLDTTPNHFATEVGMMRAENIYHIKNMEFGISTEFADRVVSHYPEINRTWLLTGVGSMLAAERHSGTNIPYYNEDITEILPSIECTEASGYANLPFAPQCDLIACVSHVDSQEQQLSTQLFLRYIDLSQIDSQKEYILDTYRGVIWCTVRTIEESRLVVINNKTSKELQLSCDAIKQAWLVVAKLDINKNY